MEICYGDVDDMIFGNEGYVSERYMIKKGSMLCKEPFIVIHSAFSIVPPPSNSSPS